MIRVLLVDDQALVRTGLAALLQPQDDMEVVGETDNGSDAVELTRSLRPDVVLMDIRMPSVSGLQATALIAADPGLDGVRVVILTAFALDEYLFEAIRAGASGFLVKDTEPADLVAGIRTVARGDALLSPGVTRRLMDRFAAKALPPVQEGLVESLTERERELVRLAAEGLSNEEIAHRIRISPTTARTHVSRAQVKLRVRDRAQLVAYAYQSGMVRPSWMD